MSKDKDFKIEENNEAVNNGNAEEEKTSAAGNGTEAAQEDAGETDSEAANGTPLEKAEEEIAVLKDKYLRSVAEFDNYRKRTLKEKTELILNGSEKAVTSILPILDDMERALAGEVGVRGKGDAK